MPPPREPRPFVPKGSPQRGEPGSSSGRAAPKSGTAKPGSTQPAAAKGGNKAPGRSKGRAANQVIPDAVSQRMASLCGEGLADLDYSAVARPYL